MSLSKLQGKCKCGKGEDGDFWVLRCPEDDENVWGICCKDKSCQREYLIRDFSPEEQDVMVRWAGLELFQKQPLKPRCNHGFQASLRRVRLKNIRQLSKGDHIIWSRMYFIWHHGVVTKVNTDDFEVVHWSSLVGGNIKIVKTMFNAQDLRRAFKVDHSNAFGHDRFVNRDLVVSRACSRLQTNRYSVINGNCEHFAMYCTHGCGTCYQNKYVVHVLGSTLLVILWRILANKGAENVFGKITIKWYGTPEIVGPFSVVFIEILNFFADWWILQKLYTGGLVSTGVFIHEIIKHFTGSVIGGILGVVGELYIGRRFYHLLPVLFTVFGKFGGMQLGSEIELTTTYKYIDQSKYELPVESNQHHNCDGEQGCVYISLYKGAAILALGTVWGYFVALSYKNRCIEIFKRLDQFQAIILRLLGVSHPPSLRENCSTSIQIFIGMVILKYLPV